MRNYMTALLFFCCFGMSAQTQPKGMPLPTENQLRWQEMEMYAFIHYSLNTYTDEEWGYGNEDPQLFNPSSLDADRLASGERMGYGDIEIVTE